MGGQKFFENKPGVGNKRLKKTLNCSRTISENATILTILGTNTPNRGKQRRSGTSLMSNRRFCLESNEIGRKKRPDQSPFP